MWLVIVGLVVPALIVATVLVATRPANQPVASTSAAGLTTAQPSNTTVTTTVTQPPATVTSTVAPEATADEHSPIYHNSTDWMWLARPPRLVPGAQFQNSTTSSACSTGFFVHKGDREFILTAGHCGDVGDQITMVDADGDEMYVGEVVESEWTHVGDVDYGLIDLSNAKAGWRSSMPTEEKLDGWAHAEWLLNAKPRLCRLGYKTGLSCGKFLGIKGQTVTYESISDRGDSGGPVFAVVDGKLYAVALTSGVSDDDKTIASAQLVENAFERWGLKLYV